MSTLRLDTPVTKLPSAEDAESGQLEAMIGQFGPFAFGLPNPGSLEAPRFIYSFDSSKGLPDLKQIYVDL